MFEKEAEERADIKYPVPRVFYTTDIARHKCYRLGFKDGAEFAYNKAKADKWHILAENDNDVPLENSIVKVLTEDNQICESKYFYDEYFEEMAFSNVGLVKVLAWKEITPSKED